MYKISVICSVRCYWSFMSAWDWILSCTLQCKWMFHRKRNSSIHQLDPCLLIQNSRHWHRTHILRSVASDKLSQNPGLFDGNDLRGLANLMIPLLTQLVVVNSPQQWLMMANAYNWLTTAVLFLMLFVPTEGLLWRCSSDQTTHWPDLFQTIILQRAWLMNLFHG